MSNINNFFFICLNFEKLYMLSFYNKELFTIKKIYMILIWEFI